MEDTSGHLTRWIRTLLPAAAVAAVAACSAEEGPPWSGDGFTDAAGDAGVDTAYDADCGCAPDEVCVPDLGCVDCWPDRPFCVGEDEVWSCNSDGTIGELVETCGEDEFCQNGMCVSPCSLAEANPSNVGCHFFAVDLDSGTSPNEGLDACAEQYSVAVANLNSYEVRVDIYRNDARYGEAVSESLVVTQMVPPDDLIQIDLPQREVDGSMGQNAAYVSNGGSGTFVSSHAYRIESSAPIVAYQFQPVVQTYSNDASILIPRQALGEQYYVMSWPAGNHCSVPSLGSLGLAWRGTITIVGVHEATHVTVYPSHPVGASDGDSGVTVPQTPAGSPMEFEIGPYDVVNLESDVPVVGNYVQCLSYADQDGDFTGSHIVASRPIAVFAGTEASFGWHESLPPAPGDGDQCCADHLEDQMFPVTALGWDFVVTRSPVRSSSSGAPEPDLYRVLATEDSTVVVTSLAPPYDRFELDEGQWATFHATTGFTAQSMGGAVMLGQFLSAADYVTPDPMGDPSFTVFPAAEQHRSEYVFLVPTTWEDNYMVLAMPEGTDLTIDGSSTLPAGCSVDPLGVLGSTTYQQLTCLMSEGVHRVEASEPVGLTVYGYFTAGSYAYPGGSDVEIINPLI